jgi:formyl-CoA transferase
MADGDGYTGDRRSSDFQNLHRNKRSLTLNLKDADGHAIFMKLAERADVIVENYRPDVKKRLGIDYDSVRKVNPRIVYGSISGFGQDGPYARRPGVDQIAQGMGGFMSVTGIPGQGPVRAGTAISDLTAGMNCAMAILIALLAREASGEGQWVHTSLLESQIGLMDFQAARWLIEHQVPQQAGNNHPRATPTGVFPTSDGYINIGAGAQHQFVRMCDVLGADDIKNEPDFADGGLRFKNRDAVNARIADYTRKCTSADVVRRMNEAGVPCGPIYALDQTFADPQVKHLGMAKRLHHPKLGDIEVVNQPFKMTAVPDRAFTPTPDAGQHTDAVLAELGYDTAAIADLHERGVV